MCERKMNKRKATLFACVFVALLLILGLDQISAESPKSTLCDRPKTTTEQYETAPQRPDDVVRESERQAMQSLRQAMVCPQNIPIPPGIPTHRVVGETIDFPRHDFERLYFEGWNECLFVIGSSTGALHDITMTSGTTSFKNRELLSTQIVEGFHDCKKLIVDLAEIYNVVLIRRVAKELHRKIPDSVGWRRR